MPPRGSNTDRIADLEQEMARLRLELRRSGDIHAKLVPPIAIRFAKTKDIDGDYPDPLTRPNCYPFIFLDGMFDTQEPGVQDIDWTDRQADPKAVAHTFGDYEFAFIPKDSTIGVFRNRGRWWVVQQPLQFICKTTGSVSAGTHTTSYHIHTGTQGAETNGGSAVPYAWPRAAIASGKWSYLLWVGSGFDLTPAEC